MTGKGPSGSDMRILAVVNRYTERKYMCLSGSWMLLSSVPGTLPVFFGEEPAFHVHTGESGE